MLPQDKRGEIRLLQKQDLEANNAFGKPLVGWSPLQHGHGGIANTRGGWACPRVVVRKIVDDTMADIYDQVMIVEKPGAIVVCRYGDKVAVIPSFRMTGDRPGPANNNYIQWLEEGNWDEMLRGLGEWKWELPAGLADVTEATDLKATILGAAQKEAFEEAGIHVIDARIVGQVNMNPTFFPHSQYVVEVQVKSVGHARNEDAEIIGNVRFVTTSELRGLVSSAQLVDSKSIAALAIAGIHF